MFSFGKKVADRLESGSRFGQKMLGSVARFGTKAASTIQSVVNVGLIATLVGMIMIGLKAHTKDPGL